MRTILSIGLVRGLIAQILGTLAGMGFIMGIRALMGIPVWNAEPVAVGGSAIGAIAFLFGAGVMSDWVKWARGIPTSDHHGPDPDKPAWIRYFSADTDHKVIGVQYGSGQSELGASDGIFLVIVMAQVQESHVKFVAEIEKS